MDVFASALAANPMQTRQDAVTALLDLIRPLKAFYSAGGRSAQGWQHSCSLR